MICKMCAKAADHGAGRGYHCRDETCPCQHRPITLPALIPAWKRGAGSAATDAVSRGGVGKRSRSGAVAVDIEPTGGVL